MERLKYLVVRKTGRIVYESRSLLKCVAYIRRTVKKGALPGSLTIMWDWPTEKRCHTCAEAENCPAFDTGVVRPCPYYHQKEV